MANRGGAAEVATKTVTKWSNALDEPGLFDIDAQAFEKTDLVSLFLTIEPARRPISHI